ncbi:MAG: ribA/ribD-fused uncharacterized protein [Myxococcota bacterium]|jgi:ribA/ribD-fused uncharacterized protein
MNPESQITTNQFVFFWKPPTIFGQWTWSEFVVDGVEYTCTEQFMMAEKARLFGDAEIRQQILDTESPRSHKSLGRKVRGFSDKRWKKNREEIVYQGNLAKFSQNPDMLQQLLETGDRILVEASPLDRIWGIGLRGDDPRASDRKQWQGLNLLGKALMRVRRDLSGP